MSRKNIFRDGMFRRAPSAVNIDSAAIAAFLRDTEAAGLELHGCMLWRDGVVAFEGWKWPYGRDRRRMTHSITKSITASAIGLLIDSDELSLDARVCSFFPEAGPFDDPRAGRITVEDLLTMRTGHDVEVSGSVWRGISTSWVDEFFRIPIVHEPGSRHVYSSAASYMLSAIVTRVTGQTLHDYLKPRLFEPLGIVDESWDLGPDGYNPGGNGVSLSLPDALKLGVLHAQGGLWRGRRILPEWWVKQATRPQGCPEYGYHWVIGDGYFAALGVFVQMVLVFPEANAVLAINAAMDESAVLLPHIRRHFPQVFAGSPSAASDERLLALTAGWPEPAPLPSLAAGDDAYLRGTLWQIEPNELGVRALALRLDGGELELTLKDETGDHTLVAARESWREGVSDLPGASLHHGYALRGAPVITGYRWLAAGELELVIHFVETAFRDRILLRFQGDRLEMDRSVNINSGARAWPTLTGTPSRTAPGLARR